MKKHSRHCICNNFSGPIKDRYRKIVFLSSFENAFFALETSKLYLNNYAEKRIFHSSVQLYDPHLPEDSEVRLFLDWRGDICFEPSFTMRANAPSYLVHHMSTGDMSNEIDATNSKVVSTMAGACSKNFIFQRLAPIHNNSLYERSKNNLRKRQLLELEKLSAIKKGNLLDLHMVH